MATIGQHRVFMFRLCRKETHILRIHTIVYRNKQLLCNADDEPMVIMNFASSIKTIIACVKRPRTYSDGVLTTNLVPAINRTDRPKSRTTVRVGYNDDAVHHSPGPNKNLTKTILYTNAGGKKIECRSNMNRLRRTLYKTSTCQSQEHEYLFWKNYI